MSPRARRHLAEYRGRVEHGQRLGRVLGVPTANLRIPRDVRCSYGTFAAIVEGLDRPYRAVAHVGVRPSVSPGGALLLEAHLLDFDGDLYGRELVVKLVHKVADEVRTPSRAALARKIAADVAAVRGHFGAAGPGPTGRAPRARRTAASKTPAPVRAFLGRL